MRKSGASVFVLETWIYAITCRANGRIYVGYTLRGTYRINDHFGWLRRGKHHNAELQADYDKFGRDAFYWVVLAKGVAFSRILDEEARLIIEYTKAGVSYNILTRNKDKAALQS